MLAEYLERLYVPAATAHWARLERGFQAARDLSRWYRRLRHHWQALHWGNLDVQTSAESHVEQAPGRAPPEAVSVQLYAEPRPRAAEVRDDPRPP
jgi:starch phosphorylase